MLVKIMIKVKKHDAELEFVKSKDGIIINVKQNKNLQHFCIVPPGNIFLLEQGKWLPVDTSSNLSRNDIQTASEYYIRPTRVYRDPIDKASVELRETITSKFHLSLLNYEKFFIDKVIYEFFNDLDLFNWFPGYGEATLVELLHNKMRAHYKDGSTEDFDMTKASESVILPFDDYKITLPPLPPLTSNQVLTSTLPPLTSSPSQPTVTKITLPPMAPISPMGLKNVPEVKLILSNDLSVPINVNDEGIETSSSLPQLDEDFAEVTTEELSETDEE